MTTIERKLFRGEHVEFTAHVIPYIESSPAAAPTFGLLSPVSNSITIYSARDGPLY